MLYSIELNQSLRTGLFFSRVVMMNGNMKLQYASNESVNELSGVTSAIFSLLSCSSHHTQLGNYTHDTRIRDFYMVPAIA